MTTTKWQIWDHPTEGTCAPAQLFIDNAQMSITVDNEQMKLVHEYEVDGDPDNEDTIERAFRYRKKWSYGEGDWPTGCHPLDNNRSDSWPLETLLGEIKARTGACLFEIGTPCDGDPEWEISGYRNGRYTRFGKTIYDAAWDLHDVLVAQVDQENQSGGTPAAVVQPAVDEPHKE